MTGHFYQDFAHHEVRSTDRWDAGDYATRQRKKNGNVSEVHQVQRKTRSNNNNNKNNNNNNNTNHNNHNANDNNNPQSQHKCSELFRTTLQNWQIYLTPKCGLVLVGGFSLCHGNPARWNLIIHPILVKEIWGNSQENSPKQLRIISVVLRHFRKPFGQWPTGFNFCGYIFNRKNVKFKLLMSWSFFRLSEEKPGRLGGGCKYFLEFSPRNLGEDYGRFPFWRTNIFQKGWFNHQLEDHDLIWGIRFKSW